MSLVSSHVCCHFVGRNWNESNPLSTQVPSAAWSPDHTSPVTFVILRLALITAAEKTTFTTVFATAKSLKGTVTSSLQGSKRSLVCFLYTFTPKPPQILDNNDKNSTALVSLVSVWLCENLRHVYARIGRKRFFSFRSDRFFHFSF